MGPYEPPPDPPPSYPGASAAVPPPPDAPPPYWQAAPPPRRSSHLGLIIAAVAVVLVLVAGVGGYVVVGLAYAQSRLNSASSSYNTVVDHLNAMNDTINSVKTQINTGAVTGSTGTSLQQNKSLADQFVSSSQTAQSQIATDDASLASADSSLKENQWLTPLSRDQLNHASARIGHARAALAAAKTITADYVQIGVFFQALYATAIDLDTLGTMSQSSDLTGAAAADVTLKADVAKAIQLDKAPGLPPEMDAALVEIQSLATDFAQLLNAAAANNATAAQSAYAALQADVAKVQAADFSGIGTEIDNFYQPLIDQYNSEVDQANQG